MAKNQLAKFPGGVEVELRVEDDGEFIGIGRVSVGGVALRSDAQPVRFRVDTPEGVLYTRLMVNEVRRTESGEVVVKLAAIGLPWGRGEYCDDYEQSIIWPALPERIEDELTLTLAPASAVFDGRGFDGFSYALRFTSRGPTPRRVHRVLTLATWEVGGSLTGNTLLSQGQCNMPVYVGSKASAFTTACLVTLDRFGDPLGTSYQLAPRGGLVQTFDLLHHGRGVLLMDWPRFESTSSLLESRAGEDVLRVVDENRFELSSDAATPAKRVLFHAGSLAEHESRDLWWEVFEHVSGNIRAAAGVKESLVRPEVGQKYSTKVEDGKVWMTVMGEWVESRDVPYAIGDRLLPVLAERGFKRFFPEVMSESDVTTYGLKRKADDGVHGDLHCSSVCATHRFFPSEFWGGIKAWRYMADKARKAGIEMGAWWAPHLSPRSPIFAEHPEYAMIGPCIKPVAGGYTSLTLVPLDWQTGAFEWTLNDLRRWHDEGGLDYLFVDSWSNLSLVQTNFRERMRTNFAALGRLFAAIQKAGIGVLSFEGISPFGVTRFGIMDIRGDLLGPMGGVVGQNDYGWWVGHEDMAYGVGLHVHPRQRSEDELRRSQFRLMSNRGAAMFDSLYNQAYNVPAWWVSLNKTYDAVLPLMKRRRVVPGVGVRWSGGGAEVVWSDAGGEVPVPAGAKVFEVVDGARSAVAAGGKLRVKAQSVYVIET